MGKKLFRHDHETHLFSLEKTDSLLKIVQLKNWIVLGAFFCILAAILLWAFFGTISTSVVGRGIFFNPEGLNIVHSKIAGQVSQIHTYSSGTVHAGDVLITLDNSSMELQLQELQRDFSAEQTLLEDFKRSSSGNESTVFQKEWDLIQLDNKISSLEEYLKEEKVLAPMESSIVEVHKEIGDEVKPGDMLVTLQTLPKEGQAFLMYIFIAIDKGGGLVREGMDVRIALDGFDVDLYGFLVGKVRKVHPLSAATQKNIHLIPSAEIKNYLGGTTPSMIIEIEIIPDSRAPSGFKWTSKEGPSYKIPAGVTGKGEITIKKMHPINYAIPSRRS